jgi:hypothetical protein
VLALVVLVPAYVVSGAFMQVAGPAWGWALAVLIAITANVPFTTLASRLMFAENLSLPAILVSSLRALPVYVATDIAHLLILGLSLLFGGIGLIWTGPATFFLPEAVLLEREGFWHALRRAAALSSAEFAQALLGAVLLGLATLVAPAVSDIAGRALIEALFDVAPPEPLWDSGGGWLSLAGFWLLVPVVTTIRFFIYINVRTRIEAWDVQTRFTAIGVVIASNRVRS